MLTSRMNCRACLLYWCALTGSALAAQTDQLAAVKKLYVEPFTIKATGSESLRKDVIAQLRKLNSISVVEEKSDADAVLSGDGEIWIKGYRSLNPRSGRWPSDGTPVYGGFLSVEVKDAKGDTLWSYLVTPGATPADISKDLSKRLVKHLEQARGPGHQ